MDTGADGAHLEVEDAGDLLVGQPLHVAQHDRGAELGQQIVQGGLQVGIQVRVAEGLLGRRFPAGDPVGLFR